LNAIQSKVCVELPRDLSLKHPHENFDCHRYGRCKQVPAEGAHLAIAQYNMAMRKWFTVEPGHIANQRQQLHRIRSVLALEILFLIDVDVTEHGVAHRPYAS